ncbi:transmembrane protein, putative [Bodo saltans]|uniref:Transmembrane protein, putative n=1 Tax=Bodo saltans TaxID=75058 RepID=A0A0S4IRC9_BODSA|nr:transmembrane protein, putative [Bodo saltans]|eukprot:CUF33888.1 transmembrane protein, putative [Bodo saltans]
MLRRCRPWAKAPVMGKNFIDRWMTTIDNVGGHYKPKEMTSKDIYNPLKTNQAWDPVASAAKFKEMTGPLKRKTGMKLDNYVDLDEAEKWMEVHHAAKRLGISESELPTLTRAIVEERWVKVYKEQSFANQQETILAAEVMLEYLDSVMFVKKNRSFYKDQVDNARSAIDNELQSRRENWKQTWYLVIGVMMFGGCALVVIAAFLNGTIDRADMIGFGNSAQNYMNSATTKATNLEPPPDYGTRYLMTPSSLELDTRNGDIEKRLVNPSLASVMAQDEEYRSQEDALTIQLINLENERRAREVREKDLMESTIVVHRKEDYDADGKYIGAAAVKSVTKDGENPFSTVTLGSFMSMAQHQFGGSRGQRFVANTSKLAAEQEIVDNKLRMVNPITEAVAAGSDAAGKTA